MTVDSAHAPPPPLGRRARRRHYGLLLAGLLLLALGLDLAVDWHLALPVCVWRRLTGVPCPFCGGTRCLMALAHGQPAEALHWNPLAWFAAIAITASGVLGLINPSWPARGWAVVRDRLSPRAWMIALVVLSANWIYLLFNLQR